MINLSEIVLKQISGEEFQQIHDVWYRKQTENRRSDTAEILSPLISSSYNELLNDFLETEYSDQVSVNKNGIWVKYYSRKMCERDISEISRIARNDRYKKGHLELHFKLDQMHTSLNRVMVKFVDIAGIIFGYEVMVPNKHHHLFSWEGELNFQKTKTFGLWLPITKKQTQRIFLLRPKFSFG